ncbi:NEAT domain-containing protein [Companilactobacillus mishanensis]|uniref:NEAT domain-containing protein n=1 Tax=Companilactobacillus mishanensis TaxID=2486008 RepID=UPI0012950A9D|nr:NEAT domain-containing protein [Companilactobacillus mishanensis]MQS88227.1 hypothetical protein [Companilactobacillus mishanensis]
MKKSGLLAVLFVLSLIFVSSQFLVNKVDAVSLQYQVLQPNGQTSHADQYMDKPANVIIKDGKYYVSMTSSVPSWIGSHPVTYTSINNGDGQIVNNAHGATFKFITTDLNKLIPVTMHLDVKVANVNMDALVYLKFLNVPALSSGDNGNNSATNSGDNGGDASANGGDTSADGKATDGDNSGEKAADGEKVTIKKPVPLKDSKKSGTPAKKDESASVIYPDGKNNSKAKKSKNHFIAITSASVVGVAAIAGVIFYFRKSIF